MWKRGHWAANCPHKPLAAQADAVARIGSRHPLSATLRLLGQAETGAAEAFGYFEEYTTGFAVIDGGATRPLAVWWPSKPSLRRTVRSTAKAD